MITKKFGDYNRNCFFSILEEAKRLFPNISFNDKTLLSIGEREPDHKIIEAKHEYKITIIEGCLDNVERIHYYHPEFEIIYGLVEDYIETYEFEKQTFDIIWWYHGPEHLENATSLKIIDDLKKHCKLLLLSFPHGEYQHDEYMDNPLETHRGIFYIDNFDGFDNCVVQYDNKTGNDKTSLDVFMLGDLNAN